MKNYILVIDEGTTGVRALLFDRNMKIKGEAYRKLELLYPGPEEVELDGEAVYEKTVEVCREVVKAQGISPGEIECVGMTAQRASWLYWDRVTGKPLRNIATWMDGRGIYQKPKLMRDAEFERRFPGLAPLLPGIWMPLVFAKIKEEEPEFAEAIKGENILFGHIDSYLGFRLTKGAVHATTRAAASCTGIYVSNEDTWNTPVLEYFGIDEGKFPDVKDEADDFGMLDSRILGAEIPIYSSFADQQAALFSQACLKPNMVKCTMGTGSFVDINTGGEYREAPGMVSGISWRLQGHMDYMIEGISYTAGACLEWAKNEFQLFKDFKDMEVMAGKVEDSGGAYFIPALAGIWGDESAKGAYMGIRPNVTNDHLMRATLEGVAFGTVSMIERAFDGDISGVDEIKISGGVAKSDLIPQIMANITDSRVVRPKSVEATALGAAEAAAIRAGWIGLSDIPDFLDIDKVYEPDENQETQKQCYTNWKKIVGRTMNWDA